MKILAVGAHADDLELGCGGSLLKWGGEGHDLVLYVATDSAYADPSGRLIRSAEDAGHEAEMAARKLGARLERGSFKVFNLAFSAAVNDAMVELFEREKPDMCLVHWHGDTHPDHRGLFLAAQHASRRCPRLLGYASNWYTGSESFHGGFHVDISSALEAKVELIAMHESENRRTRGVWEQHVRELAHICGRSCGTAAAESFIAYRYLA